MTVWQTHKQNIGRAKVRKRERVAAKMEIFRKNDMHRI